MSENFDLVNASEKMAGKTRDIQEGIDFKTEFGKQMVQSLPEIFKGVIDIIKGRSDSGNYVKKVKTNIDMVIALGDVYVKKADANCLGMKEAKDAIIQFADSYKDLLNNEENNEVRMVLAKSFGDLVNNYSQYLITSVNK